jgi:tetratricopeptide (TPR) repeat protein
VLLLKRGKNEQAITYLRRAVALSPDAPTSRHNLAVALKTQGDYAGAQSQFDAIIAYFDRLIRKDPLNPDTHFDKANALYFQGRLPEALEEYRRTLQIDPHYDSAKQCIDLIERKIGGPRDPR